MRLGDLLGDASIVLVGDQSAIVEEVELVGCRFVGVGFGGSRIRNDLGVVT
jgi:hypothetical protein